MVSDEKVLVDVLSEVHTLDFLKAIEKAEYTVDQVMEIINRVQGNE